MKTTSFFVSLLIFGGSSLAFGQVSSDADVVIVKSNPKEIMEDSSEHNRMGKKYEMSFMPVGSGPNVGASRGINVAYRLDRNNSVNLLVSRYYAGHTCSGDLSCSTDGQAVSMYYKQFVGNSFYYAVSLDLRKVSYEEAESGFYRYGLKGESAGAGVFIGNQWQWQNFTLGCDWVGMSYPIIRKTSDEFFEGSANQSWVDSKADTYVRSPTGVALRFYVGASF